MDKTQNYFKDTYHHLYNRGANKSEIFFERNNYLYFIKKMKIYKGKYDIEILSYVLMPNHFHLFVKQNSKINTISSFISSLLNSYVKSINKKYDKSGTLFKVKLKANK